jgi:nucleoprotein TPR
VDNIDFGFQAPILSQQRIEYERLQSEAGQLASQLSQALTDRDVHSNYAQETAQKLQKSSRENDLLQKQLHDLGRQVQHLLKDISRRDDPTIPSDEDLDQIELPPAENIEAVITNNLVLFRSTRELQGQNQKLLKIVRELGAKMEAEEQDYRAAMEKEQGEAVREAHEAMKTLAMQLETQQKSSEIKIQAYMKERDALKSMLARAERSSGAFGTGADGDAAMDGYHEGALGGTQSDMAREFAEMQNQFESYRTEMGMDSMKLRDEVVASQREAGQLNTALAKANAKIEYLNGRFPYIVHAVILFTCLCLDVGYHRPSTNESRTIRDSKP